MLYLKLKKNSRNNYYTIILTKTEDPLTVIEILGSIKILKETSIKIIKLDINRVKFWLINGVRLSYELVKILIDINLLPEPIYK